MQPISLQNLNNQFDSIDIFIASASFEDRCLTTLTSLDKSKIAKGIIFYNKNEEHILIENVNKLKECFNESEVLELNSNQPMITASTIQLFFSKLESHYKTLFIDTTTFTHEGLLIFIKFVQLYSDKFDNIFLGYVGAAEYSFDEDEVEKKWLSKGIKSIRSVLGYPGLLKPSTKNHLIILFGFESERTRKLIESFEFEKVSLGFGPAHDSISHDHYQINYERHLELLSIYPFAEKFEFSLTDPYEAQRQITDQINKFTDYNIVIAPLNNKLSTVGAALTAFQMPQVQLCYVAASQYNLNGYSKPSDKCYIVELKL